MGKNKYNKPRDIRKNFKQENRKKFREESKKREQLQKSTFMQSLKVDQIDKIVQEPEIQEFSQDELEFIRIASSHPLEYADFISRGNYGLKFKTLEQREQFITLLGKFNKTSLGLMKSTELRGKELDELTVKRLLESDELTPIERKILENKLPKQVER